MLIAYLNGNSTKGTRDPNFNAEYVYIVENPSKEFIKRYNYLFKGDKNEKINSQDAVN